MFSAKNPFILGQKVKGQGHNSQVTKSTGVQLCTLVSVGFYLSLLLLLLKCTA